MTPSVKCMSVFSTSTTTSSILGVHMAPCWPPNSKRIEDNHVLENIGKVSNRQRRCGALLVLSFVPTWLQVVAQDRPREHPETDRKPLRRPPELVPRAFGSAQNTRHVSDTLTKTSRHEPIFVYLVLHHFQFPMHF